MPVNVVSMNPDTFESAGLADDFDGEIVKVRLKPFDYDGKLDHHVLACAVTIKPDDDSGYDEFTQSYSLGDKALDMFSPSMDGESPCDLESDDEEDWEGVCLIPTGSKSSLNNNSNWAHFLFALRDAGYPTNKLGGSVDTLEGTKGHFNRIEQQKRSGLRGAAAENDRRPQILVMTEITEVGGGKAKKASKKKSAPKKAAAKKAASKKAASTDDFGDQVAEVISGALESGDGTLEKGKLAQIVIKKFAGKERATAIKTINDVKFLSGREEWEYDADSGLLYTS